MKSRTKILISTILMLASVHVQAINTCEIWTYNYTASNLTFYDTAYGNVWDRYASLAPNDFQNGSFDIDANYTTSSGSAHGYIYDWFGYGVMPTAGDYDTLGIGLYKISTTYNNGQWGFYLDLRDSLGLPPIDLKLKFANVGGYGVWSYLHANGCDGNTWHTIADVDTISIWEIWDICEASWTDGTSDTDHLQPADPTSLTVTKSGGHPNLSWTGTPELEDVEKYEVWRKYGTYYTRIANNLTAQQYTDTEVDAFPKSSLYYYKIRAVSGDGNVESEGYSNEVSFLGDGPVGKNIAMSDEGLLPTDYEISSYPNPFNPSTTIVYELPNQSDVEILIYDISGHKINVFTLNEKSAGTHELIWAGENDSGNLVKSGTYFARVRAGSFSRVIRMIYLK